jgi:hypothetical protein
MRRFQTDKLCKNLPVARVQNPPTSSNVHSITIDTPKAKAALRDDLPHESDPELQTILLSVDVA